MTTASTEARPTSRQLRYLKMLAQRTETTFVYPSTRVQASREIERLWHRPAPPRVPRTELDPGEEPQTYATAVCDHELRRRGCSASWRHGRELDPIAELRRAADGRLRARAGA